MMKTEKLLARQIEVILRETQLTQEQLGQMLGVSRNSIVNWLKGKNSPAKDKANRIQEIFGNLMILRTTYNNQIKSLIKDEFYKTRTGLNLKEEGEKEND